MQHNAMIVTGNLLLKPESPDEVRRAGGRSSYIEIARERAAYVCGGRNVSAIVEAELNGIASFLVGTSGSKENRDEYDVHLQRLWAFDEYLKLQSYGPGEGHPLSWVLLTYGRYAETDGAAVVPRVMSADRDVRHLEQVAHDRLAIAGEHAFRADTEEAWRDYTVMLEEALGQDQRIQLAPTRGGMGEDLAAAHERLIERARRIVAEADRVVA